MVGTKKYGEENYISNLMGIPAHDYIENTYDANNNIIATTYKIGGSSGDVVAIVGITYDANNNPLTVERTT